MTSGESRDFPVYTFIDRTPGFLFQELREEAFTHPFFNDGVSHFSDFGDRKVNVDKLELPKLVDPLQINGFIFHTSHCGSTLLSRMLSALPGVRVVSETEAINSLLLSYLYYEIDRSEVLTQLKCLIELYRQKMGDKKNLIFKTTSWNVFLIDLFQELYPEVPWMYIDRETEACVDSSLKDGGGFVQWRQLSDGIPIKYFLQNWESFSTQRAYVAAMIDEQRQVAQKAKRGNFLFLEYPDFLEQYSSQILPHFGLKCSGEAVQASIEQTKYQSKSLEPVPFQKDINRRVIHPI